MACFSCAHDAALFGSSHRDGASDAFPEPGVEPNYAPSRSVAIEHLDLELSLEPVERRWSGVARLRIRPLPIHDGTARFDLDEVEVDEVTDAAGAALDWRHGGGALIVRGVTDATTVVVRFHGSDPRRGLYFTGPTAQEPERQHMAWTQCQDEDGHFVFPCHDHPRIKHPWSIRLDAPAGYTLLSNGRLLEKGEDAGRAWARYEQAGPMPAYLFTAVAAKLTPFETKWRDRPVRYLVPVGEEAHVLRAMGKTPLMMDEFSRLTGVDYPWPRYDQVVVHEFIFGGMENTGCTTMTDALLVDEKAVIEWDPDGLVAHELAHQWFGDLVTCQDWSQAWLNESWATFLEAVWWEADRDEHEATWYRFNLAQSYLSEDGGRYRRPIVSYRFKEPIDVFDRHLYEKGACVLATLRSELGADAFWTGVRAYLEAHARSTAHTRHFQRALEDATGKNLDRFFDQWIYGAGHPNLEVKLGSGDGLVTVSVKQTQSGDQTAEVFHFSLRVVLVGEDDSERVVDLPVRERERTFAVPVHAEVATVRVDPGFRVLAAIELDGPRAWLEALLDDPCPVLALRAAKALLREGSKPSFTAAVDALSGHPFHGVRGAIAKALGDRGGADARDALLAAAGSEPDARVRRAIADALGCFRDPAAADALITVLRAPIETWHLTAVALQALGRTRDPRAVAEISRFLDTDAWMNLVRQRALLGLAATEDAAVLDTLLARTREPWPDRVRSAAADALGRLGDKVEAVRQAARERLEEMVHEPGYRTQMASVGALGQLKDPKATGTLETVHQSAPDGRLRRAAYEALGQIRKGRNAEQGVAALRRKVDELTEQNHELRRRIEKLEHV